VRRLLGPTGPSRCVAHLSCSTMVRMGESSGEELVTSLGGHQGSDGGFQNLSLLSNARIAKNHSIIARRRQEDRLIATNR
jgi:hypothetical protein